MTVRIATPSLSLSISMLPLPTMLPGDADELEKRLNENVTTAAATRIRIKAMISRFEFLRIQVSRSWVVGSCAGVGAVVIGRLPRS